MKTLEMADAEGPVAAYARRRNRDMVMLTFRGKPVAMLTPIPITDMESARLSINPRFLAIIERSWQNYLANGGIPASEMRKRLGLPPKNPAKPRRHNS